MSEPVAKTRTFLLRDARGRNVDAVAQQGRHFSITSQHGAAHDEILAAAPADVRADIEALIAVHLCSGLGTPMHAIANSSHHLREGKFDEAARSLGNAVSVEDLYPVFGEASRRAADPDLVKQYLRKPTEEAKRLRQISRNLKDGVTSFALPKQERELMESIASLLGRRKIERHEIEDIAAGKFDDKTRSHVADALKVKVFNDAITDFVEAKCRGVWRERADAARAALNKPDYRAEGRPAIVDDPTTFEGFIAKWGLEMSLGRARRGDGGPDSRRWTVSISGREGRTENPVSQKVLEIDFGRGNPSEPTLETLMQCLQSEFCSVMNYDRDDWLVEFGFNGDMKTLRKGEAAYDLMRHEQIPRFKEITGGEECFRELMTSVGDNPPMDIEDYDAVTGKGVSPAL
jgi:hypothetical protein